MARMLGRSWKWRKDTRWHKRREQRQWEREMARREADGYWPGGYAPHELLSARHDSPDLTGPLVSSDPVDEAEDLW